MVAFGGVGNLGASAETFVCFDSTVIPAGRLLVVHSRILGVSRHVES